MKLSRIGLSGLIIVLGLPVSACGSSAKAGSPPMTQVVTHTVTAMSTGPAAEPSASTAVDLSTPTEVDVTTTRPTLAAGQRLGLDAFFDPSYVWEESRYDVADRGQVQGVSAPVTSCSQPRQMLELRLENKFSRLKFSVGQSNDSESSKYNLVVAVTANGKQVDVRNIPFNAVQEFDVAIDGVNALEISFARALPSGGCDNRSVRAVLFDSTLS